MVYLLIHFFYFYIPDSILLVVTIRITVVLFSNVITIYIIVLCTLSVTVAILAQGTPWGDALCAALL